MLLMIVCLFFGCYLNGNGSKKQQHNSTPPKTNKQIKSIKELVLSFGCYLKRSTTAETAVHKKEQTQTNTINTEQQHKQFIKQTQNNTHSNKRRANTHKRQHTNTTRQTNQNNNKPVRTSFARPLSIVHLVPIHFCWCLFVCFFVC